MRALETEQHAAARTSTNGAEDPRRVHLAPQPSTRRGPHGRWLHGAPSWMIAGIVSAGVVTALVVQLTSGAGTTAPPRPGHALATGTAATTASLSAATARFLAVEHAADRNLGPARSQSARAARLSRHRQTSRPHPSTPWIPLVEHDHIIGQRHIRSGRYHATVRPLKLQPVLELRVVRIRSRISQRPSRTPRPARTRARAPPPHPKPPSAHSSQEPAPAAASRPHTSNAHRKVGNT